MIVFGMYLLLFASGGIISHLKRFHPSESFLRIAFLVLVIFALYRLRTIGSNEFSLGGVAYLVGLIGSSRLHEDSDDDKTEQRRDWEKAMKDGLL